MIMGVVHCPALGVRLREPVTRVNTLRVAFVLTWIRHAALI